MNKHKLHTNKQRGGTLIMYVVFMAVFLMVFISLVSFQLTYFKWSNRMLLNEQVFRAAEAGLQRFDWALKRFFPDHKEKIEEESFVGMLKDPEGNVIANYSLNIVPKVYCGQTLYYDVTSSATSTINPNVHRELKVRFIRPNVANYAAITNAGVWWGPGEKVVGPVQSNSGIRMDGENNSLIASGVDSWWCDWSFGCNPPTRKPGVFGSGPGHRFWSYPVPKIDFSNFTLDYNMLKSLAQANNTYIANYSRNHRRGYRLVLKPDRSIDVYRVSRTTRHRVYSLTSGRWGNVYDQIRNQRFLKTIQVPEDCPVVFVEDKVWLEGEWSGKLTLVSAYPNSTRFDPDIYIIGNITYSDTTDSGILAIAERSVLIGFDIPYNLTVMGIYVAQKGGAGRDFYACWYAPYDVRGTFRGVGSFVSPRRPVTYWTYSWCGSPGVSGFLNGDDNTYDRRLANDPPPFVPQLSDKFRTVYWEDLK